MQISVSNLPLDADADDSPETAHDGHLVVGTTCDDRAALLANRSDRAATRWSYVSN